MAHVVEQRLVVGKQPLAPRTSSASRAGSGSGARLTKRLAVGSQRAGVDEALQPARAAGGGRLAGTEPRCDIAALCAFAGAGEQSRSRSVAARCAVVSRARRAHLRRSRAGRGRSGALDCALNAAPTLRHRCAGVGAGACGVVEPSAQ